MLVAVAYADVRTAQYSCPGVIARFIRYLNFVNLGADKGLAVHGSRRTDGTHYRRHLFAHGNDLFLQIIRVVYAAQVKIIVLVYPEHNNTAARLV